MRYRIALHQSDEGFSVSVPGLPGCWSQGATESEAIENIKDAIRDTFRWSMNSFRESRFARRSEPLPAAFWLGQRA